MADPDAAAAPPPPAVSASPQPRSPSVPELPARPAAAGPASAAQPVSPAVGARPPDGIGSEGFAPLILQAMDSGSAQLAAKAAQQLYRCRGMEEQLAGLQRFGATPEGAKYPAIYKRMVEDVLLEQRRCQTITPELDAQRPALLLKAMRGGVDGAARDYWFEVKNRGGVPAGLTAELANGLRAEADAGNPHSMGVLARQLAELSTAELDRRAYKRASQLIQAADGQSQGFLNAIIEALAKFGIQPESVEPLRKEPPAADIDAKVQALLEAHRRWEERRKAAFGG